SAGLAFGLGLGGGGVYRFKRITCEVALVSGDWRRLGTAAIVIVAIGIECERLDGRLQKIVALGIALRRSTGLSSNDEGALAFVDFAEGNFAGEFLQQKCAIGFITFDIPVYER